MAGPSQQRLLDPVAHNSTAAAYTNISERDTQRSSSCCHGRSTVQMRSGEEGVQEGAPQSSRRCRSRKQGCDRPLEGAGAVKCRSTEQREMLLRWAGAARCCSGEQGLRGAAQVSRGCEVPLKSAARGASQVSRGCEMPPWFWRGAVIPNRLPIAHMPLLARPATRGCVLRWASSQ